jgi:hypothetical protein
MDQAPIGYLYIEQIEMYDQCISVIVTIRNAADDIYIYDRLRQYNLQLKQIVDIATIKMFVLTVSCKIMVELSF